MIFLFVGIETKFDMVFEKNASGDIFELRKIAKQDLNMVAVARSSDLASKVGRTK